MKRTITIILSAILLLASVGCSCGLSCCAKSQVPTPPENAAFTLAYDDASIPTLLAYYQANTGYQPTFVNVTESGEENVEADPAALAVTACVAVLKDEANAAALEAAVIGIMPRSSPQASISVASIRSGSLVMATSLQNRSLRLK